MKWAAEGASFLGSCFGPSGTLEKGPRDGKGGNNGLKIRPPEKRGMGSNPIIGTAENVIY